MNENIIWLGIMGILIGANIGCLVNNIKIYKEKVVNDEDTSSVDFGIILNIIAIAICSVAAYLNAMALIVK